MVNKFRHSMFTPLLLLLLFVPIFLGCAPRTVVVKKQPNLSEVYYGYSGKKILDEIHRLERLIDGIDIMVPDSGDSTLSTEEIVQRLFELSIHRNNPVPDYAKAYTYAERLYKSRVKKKLYYLNWGRMLKSYASLSTAKDSLEFEIHKISENTQSLRYYSKNKSRRISNLATTIEDQEKTIEEQKEIIAQQKETIEKLKKLDIMMEQQRSRIE